MPLFGGKNNKFKVDPPKIRVEKVTVSRPAPKQPAAAQRPLANGSSSARPSPKPSSALGAGGRQKSNSPYPSSSDERRVDRKRKAGGASTAPRRSPAAERVEFDKDSDADEEDDGWLTLETRKRQRKGTLGGRSEDPNRKLKNASSFEDRHEGLEFIHAVEVASLDCKCVPVMGAQKEDVSIRLQYPSLKQQEK